MTRPGSCRLRLRKQLDRRCFSLAWLSCQFLKPGSNSLDGLESASTMMWLQHCQVKLIKIHVVHCDIIIKLTQFPNGVQVFAGLEQEFFHGLKMCSCSASHDLKPLPLAVIAQKQSNGTSCAPIVYLLLFKKSHPGQTQGV